MAAPRFAFAQQVVPAYAKTVGRAVYVKIHPQPRNLAESREVLQVLQQYGEVVSYRRLKHDPYRPAPNKVLAVYQNANSAQSIIDASPLRFESGRAESSSSMSQFMPPKSPSTEEEKDNALASRDESDHAQEEFDEVNTARQRPNEAPGEDTAFRGLGGTARWGKMRSSLTTEQAATSLSHSNPPETFTPNPTPLKASATDLPNPPSDTQQILRSPYAPREFHLSIEQSHLNHHAYIKRQHYYGSFHLDPTNLMVNDLQERVPVAGMADCQFGKMEVPLRIRIKQLQEDKDDWMSLRSLWEEGERERESEMGGEEARRREWESRREMDGKRDEKKESKSQSESERRQDIERSTERWRDRERKREWKTVMERWRERKREMVREVGF